MVCLLHFLVNSFGSWIPLTTEWAHSFDDCCQQRSSGCSRWIAERWCWCKLSTQGEQNNNQRTYCQRQQNKRAWGALGLRPPLHLQSVSKGNGALRYLYRSVYNCMTLYVPHTLVCISYIFTILVIYNTMYMCVHILTRDCRVPDKCPWALPINHNTRHLACVLVAHHVQNRWGESISMGVVYAVHVNTCMGTCSI